MSRRAWRWLIKFFQSAVSPRTRPQSSSLWFEPNSIRNSADAQDAERVPYSSYTGTCWPSSKPLVEHKVGGGEVRWSQ
jgi:hypothetical protein